MSHLTNGPASAYSPPGKRAAWYLPGLYRARKRSSQADAAQTAAERPVSRRAILNCQQYTPPALSG